MELHHAEMRRIEYPGRCACGEALDVGEMAGVDPTGRELLCLWCLADLQAGRRRPRRRETRPGVPERWHSPTHIAITRVAPGAAHKRRGGPTTAGSVVLALLVVVAGLIARPHIFTDDPTREVSAGAPFWSGGLPVGGLGSDISVLPPIESGTADIWPPVPTDARQTPLGLPPAQATPSVSYAFMATRPSGEPVRFDPCRPIHLVVNNALAPARSEQLLREASQAVSTATGLVFVIDGPTDEPPRDQRLPIDVARHGNRWAPVLVAWTDPATAPGLAGRVAGLAGPTMAPYRTEDQMHWVSGSVLLDGPTFSDILQRPDGYEKARAIVMHELAHLVGLSHVKDTSELMADKNSRRTSFGPGDNEGLRRLGGGPCFSS